MNYVPGLEGVIAGETAISHVEGDIGRLSYRGLPIEDIVTRDYLSVVSLVLFGELPGPDGEARLSQYLERHQLLTDTELKMIRQAPKTLHPMKVIQGLIPLLQLTDDPFPCDARFSAHDVSQGLQILARYPALIAAVRKHRDGGEFNQQLNAPYLDRYLTMMNGAEPEKRASEVFRTVQLLQLDHSFNAGTFAGRVIASTLADVPAVLSGAAGALSGVLHGGADQAALEDARRVGHPDNAAEFVDDVLARKGRIMGMGHREYRTVDPRSNILKPLAVELCHGTHHENTLNTLMAIESVFNQRMLEKGKDVRANLEFYKGVVYEALGLTPEYFTATFALSRSVGWLAHFLESRESNRIIRPAAAYVGRPVVTAA